MNYLIFGTGTIYHRYQEKLRELLSGDRIAGFLDNNKTGAVDGVPVYSPKEIGKLQYDRILIMAAAYREIHDQLIGLSVPEEKILYWEIFRAERSGHEVVRYNPEDPVPTLRAAEPEFEEMSLQKPDRTGEDTKVPVCIGMNPDRIVSKSPYIEPAGYRLHRILVIAWRMNYDGGSLAAVNACRALKKAGYSVCLAASEIDDRLLKELCSEQLEVLVCPALPVITEAEERWICCYDAVIVNVFQMIEAASEISKFRPVLWWIHEAGQEYSSIYPEYTFLYRSYAEKLKQGAQRIYICAVSSRAKQGFEELFPGRAHAILPHGIPDQTKKKVLRGSGELQHRDERGCSCKFPQHSDDDRNCMPGSNDPDKNGAACTDSENSERRITFAVIGGVSYLKAQDIFLDAAEKFREETGLRFEIVGRVGTTSYAEEIRRRAESLPNVTLRGELTRAEMAREYRNIDAIVCSSRDETLSSTIIEGLMYGKVVIMTDHTGIAQYIRNGRNGFICRTEDADSLSDTMRYVVTHWNEMDTVREEARKTYERYFSMDVFGKRLAGELEKAVDYWKTQSSS